MGYTSYVSKNNKSTLIENRSPDENAIKDPESGQWILGDELGIFADEQVINDVVYSYRGELTISIPKTSTYQVKFPVSSLDELNVIKQELENKGIQTMYVRLLAPNNH